MEDGGEECIRLGFNVIIGGWGARQKCVEKAHDYESIGYIVGAEVGEKLLEYLAAFSGVKVQLYVSGQLMQLFEGTSSISLMSGNFGGQDPRL